MSDSRAVAASAAMSAGISDSVLLPLPSGRNTYAFCATRSMTPRRIVGTWEAPAGPALRAATTAGGVASRGASNRDGCIERPSRRADGPVDVRVALPELGIEETIEALVAGETYIVARVEDDRLVLEQLADAPYYR